MQSPIHAGVNAACTPKYNYEYWLGHGEALTRRDELLAQGKALFTLDGFSSPRYAYGCPSERTISREDLIKYPNAVWAVEWL